MLSVTPREKADGMELNFQQVNTHTDTHTLSYPVCSTLSVKLCVCVCVSEHERHHGRAPKALHWSGC